MQDGVLVRYLMTILEVMRTDYNIAASELWSAAGVVPLVTTGATDRVNTAYADKLWVAASQLSDGALGLKVGAAIRYTSYASLGHLLVTCDTVGDTLYAITENAHYVGAGHFSLHEHENELQLEYRLDAKHPIADQRAVASLLPFSTLAKSVAGGVLPSRVWLQMCKPTNYALYEDYFGVPVFFGMEANGVAWDRKLLHLPMPDANSALNELLLQHVKKELSQQDTMAAKVTSIINDILDTGDVGALCSLNLTYCATLIDVPRRSLQRALALEGLKFRDLLAEARQNKAIFLLKETADTVAEIAEKLGYSEAAAFVRAFRVWQKISPSKYRANCHNTPVP